MKMILKAAVAVLAGSIQAASAQPVRWQAYSIPETGTSVDIPTSIFSERLGSPPQGDGQRFRSADGLGWRLHGSLDQRQIYRVCYVLLVVTAVKLLWDGVSGYMA